MDLAHSIVTMDVAEARAAYDDYAQAVKARHNDEDAAIAAGYKALADGKTLLSMRSVFAAAGVDEQHRPRLAIAPANTDWVWMSRTRDGACSFSPTRQPRRADARGRVNLPAGTLPAIPDIDWASRYIDTAEGPRWKPGLSSSLRSFDHRAMVPTVPPKHRPTRALTGYHVLFEAEWTHEPPIDPALVRHLSGDLWVVLATWDLTDLERAVLAQRLIP